MKKAKRTKKSKRLIEKPDRLDHKKLPGNTYACWGRVQAIYLFKRKLSGASRFLKIGEYCERCGANHIYRRFERGISREMLKELEAGAEHGK